MLVNTSTPVVENDISGGCLVYNVFICFQLYLFCFFNFATGYYSEYNYAHPKHHTNEIQYDSKVADNEQTKEKKKYPRHVGVQSPDYSESGLLELLELLEELLELSAYGSVESGST